MVRFRLALIRFFLTALAHLPLRGLYVISDMLTPVVYHVVRYRRKLVRKNLTASFPEKTKAEIRRIERQFYRHFGSILMETIKLLHISDEELRRRVRFTNLDVFERLSTDKKPIFAYMGHYSNWEYIPSITLWCKPDLHVCQVYHPLSDKAMDAFMLHLRGRFNSLGIPQDETVRTILRRQAEGMHDILGLIADQRPPKPQHKEWISFLHQPTAIIVGGEHLGKRLQAHYIYAEMNVVRRGYYDIIVHELQPNPDESFSVSKQYMHLLEQTINKAPQYYLWTHNRWKWAQGEDGTLYRNR
ncbi:MAG: lysophospholipid acyltransferase family protein [Bacteroidaceae bacterium]|nr:lysophospholipid acyltransferase family protein [Bacteroidaceae bacterium]